jgi:hypothetical protein
MLISRKTITQKSTLVGLFLLTVLLTLSFAIVMTIWNFQIIDEMYIPSEIIAHVSEMTEQQRLVHIWTTATLDVIYPFVYGGLLIGITLKCYEDKANLFLIPSVAVIPVDLLEGVVQVLVLSGYHDFANFKLVLTPLKLTLLLLAIAICVRGWLKIRKQGV